MAKKNLDVCQALQELIGQTGDAHILRRALAVLWLTQGESARDVAERLLVSRATVYNWYGRFRDRDDLGLVERLSDAARSGRPALADEQVESLLAELVDVNPIDLGYRQTIWTADLLARHLRKAVSVEISAKTVGRVLDRLEVAWKRPRHHLSLKPDHWRQAKGGSNAASGADSGR